MQENIVHLAQWKQFFSCNQDVQEAVESEDGSLYAEKTRVYYNSFWIAPDAVQKYVNNVCVTHARRDVSMTTVVAPNDLLSVKERLRARKRVLTVRSTVYALGGCGPFPRTILPKNEHVETLIVFFPTIDWDLKGLEAESFFILNKGHERMKKIRDKGMLLSLGQGCYFDENAYACCVAEDVLLLLMAAEEEQLRQKRSKKLWIKLPPLGYGPGVYSWNGLHIGPLLVRSFFWGVLCALNSYDWTRIGVLEIVDITKHFSLTPNWPSVINGVQIVSGRLRDILDFSSSTNTVDGPTSSGPTSSSVPPVTEDPSTTNQEPSLAEYDASVVCPGDAFAWPGNELHDSCLNSMIGNNTSLRRMGSPLYNSALQCANTFVPVRVPIKLQYFWWPPREFSALPLLQVQQQQQQQQQSIITQ